MSQEMISVQARHYQVTDEDIEYYESNNLMGPHLFCPDSTPQSTFDAYALKRPSVRQKKGITWKSGHFLPHVHPLTFNSRHWLVLTKSLLLLTPIHRPTTWRFHRHANASATMATTTTKTNRRRRGTSTWPLRRWLKANRSLKSISTGKPLSLVQSSTILIIMTIIILKTVLKTILITICRIIWGNS